MNTQKSSLTNYILLACMLAVCIAAWYIVPSSWQNVFASQEPTPTATLIVRECPIPAPESDTDYRTLARMYACENGVDPNVFERQINQESGFNPNVTSHAGAQGIAQFMPATAQSLGIDPWDPKSALLGAAKFMKQHLDFYQGDYAKALAAYNAGGAHVNDALLRCGDEAWRTCLYEETQHYILVILGE